MYVNFKFSSSTLRYYSNSPSAAANFIKFPKPQARVAFLDIVYSHVANFLGY